MDEIIRLVQSVFPSEQLVTAPPHLVNPLRIPDRSKQFLLTVGLPREFDFPGGQTLCFDLLDRLPTLRQLFPEHASRIDPGWDACRFLTVDDVGGGYFLNQDNNGSIWHAFLDSTESGFVNTSVETFAAFLAEFTRFRDVPQSDDDAAVLRIVGAMEERLRAIDPTAMADDAQFWPLVFEDVRLSLR